MSIIEKLGITPGPWIVAPHSINDRDIEICTESESKMRAGKIYRADWICDLCADNTDGGITRTENNAQLIATAPEMLEALIDDMIKTKSEGWCEVCQSHDHADGCKKLLAVEKATGKTWSEIKELL